MSDTEARLFDVVVYKAERLTRSSANFTNILELFSAPQVSFVSVAPSFNTTSFLGRLTLNALLSLAPFEEQLREQGRTAIGSFPQLLSRSGHSAFGHELPFSFAPIPAVQGA